MLSHVTAFKRQTGKCRSKSLRRAHERSVIFDRLEPGQLRALVREAQQLHSRAFRQERDRGKIAPQHAKEVEFAVRQVVDAVGVEIESLSAFPEIADAANGPAVRSRFASYFDRVQVFYENIRGKPIVVRIRAEAQADVVVRDLVADDLIAIALVERQADRVVRDLVVLEARRRWKDSALSH